MIHQPTLDEVRAIAAKSDLMISRMPWTTIDDKHFDGGDGRANRTQISIRHTAMSRAQERYSADRAGEMNDLISRCLAEMCRDIEAAALSQQTLRGACSTTAPLTRSLHDLRARPEEAELVFSLPVQVTEEPRTSDALVTKIEAHWGLRILPGLRVTIDMERWTMARIALWTRYARTYFLRQPVEEFCWSNLSYGPPSLDRMSDPSTYRLTFRSPEDAEKFRAEFLTEVQA